MAVDLGPMEAIGARQFGLSNLYRGWGLEDRATSQSLLSQPIDRYQNLMAGNRSTMADAAMPKIPGIESQYRTGRESIYSTVPKGSRQDAALQGANLWKANAVSDATNSAFTEGNKSSLTLAAQLSRQGLEAETGALGGLKVGAGAEKEVVDYKAKEKEQLLGALGGFANLAGQATSKA
jgi:hypothetical protein